MENVNDFSKEISAKAIKIIRLSIEAKRLILCCSFAMIVAIIFCIQAFVLKNNIDLKFDFSVLTLLFATSVVYFLLIFPINITEEKVKECAKQLLKDEKASLKESLRKFKNNKEMVGLQEIELQARLELLEDYEFSQEEAAVFGKKS
jgi:hypothetical protein